MKYHHRKGSCLALVLAMAGYLAAPTMAKEPGTADSPEIAKLLADTKVEAAELSRDSVDLESFTRSKLSWQSYSGKIEMVKQHINNTGKLLAQIKAAESTGSLWQQSAVSQIEPLLKELAANTQATINHLNANPTKIHFPESTDYVKANRELANNLETLIRDFVAYGDAKEKIERLGKKMEISE